MMVFEWSPLYTVETVRGHRVLITEMESGKEYRYYKGRRPREWKLGFTGEAETIREIEEFFDSVGGNFGSFLWLPPNESQYIIVRFKDEILNGTLTGVKIKSIELTLREVL